MSLKIPICMRGFKMSEDEKELLIHCLNEMMEGLFRTMRGLYMLKTHLEERAPDTD